MKRTTRRTFIRQSLLGVEPVMVGPSLKGLAASDSGGGGAASGTFWGLQGAILPIPPSGLSAGGRWCRIRLDRLLQVGMHYDHKAESV